MQTHIGSTLRTPIARPESVVMLAETVRRARELPQADRIDTLKLRVCQGRYAVSSKHLAERLLAGFGDDKP